MDMKKILDYIPYFRKQRLLAELHKTSHAELERIVNQMKYEENIEVFFRLSASHNQLIDEINDKRNELRKKPFWYFL